MFDIVWIQSKVRDGNYYFSRHGDQERQNDNLTVAEVEEALLTGRVLEQYEDTGRGESCLVVGFTESGNHCIWCVASSPPYTFFPLNGDMELNRNR